MLSRRSFLRITTATIAGTSLSPLLGRNSGKIVPQRNQSKSNLDNIGPLLPPDANGLMLPRGFSSRIVASSGMPPSAASTYIWHSSPDGGATFPTNDGGWIYVSNSELNNKQGGAGSIQFDMSGNIVNAYSILENTSRNCAGGATPWNTWLSCEEIDGGLIWECDPYGKVSPTPRATLGTFAHEAVTFDTRNNILYMTEDKRDGCFYRYVPNSFNDAGFPDLTSGTLEVAAVDSKSSIIRWAPIPDPNAKSQPTRYQVATRTTFNGGEGIVYYDGKVSFATKGDDRIWTYDTLTQQISVIYDANTHPTPILTGLDNITLSQDGELVVGEDGGDLQIVAITKTDRLVPLVQLVGHDRSEMTGPAFSPDGKRLYFSSQRGTTGSSSSKGTTYEVLGPFHI